MFYLVIIQNNTTQAVYPYDTLDAAISMFHTELAYRGDGRDKTVCVILNQKGELVKRELWERPLEQVQETEAIQTNDELFS